MYSPMIRHVLFFLILFISTYRMALAQAGGQTPLVITIDTKAKAQTIQNIGASGCWYSEGIGRYWPAEKKEHLAQLLFSRKLDKAGNPTGIGLSAWRFNIGGGTTEQGEASGIRDPNRRAESFLNSDGTYDWSKQPGYVWFLRKAKEYGVEELIAFSNTPPVFMTQNGLGFKTNKDHRANLKPEKYGAFADFLTEVIAHFEKQGLPFSYICPVNEPQWAWDGEVGKAKQEGSPWTNEEIYRVVKALDASLKQKRLKTRILAPEAAKLTFLYGEKTAASRQIQQFYADTSKLNFNGFSSVPRLVAGHSYFTDEGDANIIHTRRALADTTRKYQVEFWQSEYSMLGNGYKEGSTGKRSQMDCALFLAKIIHHDFTVANATAWQLWNAYEPGKAEFDTRYYLMALHPEPGFENGDYTVTKNLWGLGHYSLFIRPGMQRLHVKRSDQLGELEAAQKTMVSAYTDHKGKLVVVALNYTASPQPLALDLQHTGKIKKALSYTTTASAADNMRSAVVGDLKKGITLPARSITTLVLNP
ncbi:MAG: glycoside hydrolase [Adhaeribacter sp.]